MLPIFLCLMQSVKAPNGALRFCLALDKASRSIRPQLPPDGTVGVGLKQSDLSVLF